MPGDCIKKFDYTVSLVTTVLIRESGFLPVGIKLRSDINGSNHVHLYSSTLYATNHRPINNTPIKHHTVIHAAGDSNTMQNLPF